MAYSFLVASDGSSASGSATTSPSIDTSGADLIVAVIGGRSSDTLTFADSKSNTWSSLTIQTSVNDFGSAQMFYCQNPTVGSGHTFTVSGAADICTLAAAAFSGSQASPFDVENGAGGTFGDEFLLTGAVTPSVDNELIVAGLVVYTQLQAMLIGAGFSFATNSFASLTLTSPLAYLIQTSAASENPQWDAGNQVPVRMQATVIATFKAATTGGSVSPRLQILGVS